MAEFSEPLFWSDSHVTEMCVEDAIRIIQETPDINIRKTLMYELHMHQVDYPCPLLRRILQELNIRFGHKPFNKPPTQNNLAPENLRNFIFKTSVIIPLNKREKELVEVNMQLLHEWIRSNFLSQCTKEYSWLALWCFLKDNMMLEDTKVSSFCLQMANWFPNVSKLPDKGEVNRYREPYLGNTHYQEWRENEFIKHMKGKSKQSVKGFKHLHRICFNLAGTFAIKRLGDNTKQH